jgi:hypothetical protein
MKTSSQVKPGIGISVIKMIEKDYDWGGKTGAILLKETRDFIIALEGLGYTEKQIIDELKSNGNICDYV